MAIARLTWRRFALVLVAGALWACSDPPTDSKTCTGPSDCEEGFLCDGGKCVVEVGQCSATDPCPEGYACCSGQCSASACCLSDSDCPQGHCGGGACKLGLRPGCTQQNPTCPPGEGRCLVTVNKCVECLFADDCVAPNQVCSPQHQCVLAGGCTAQMCAETGKICAPEEGGCRSCLSNAECGQRVCDDGTCVTCTTAGDCGTNRDCLNGACVTATGTPCTTNDQCADGLLCKLVGINKQCEPCLDDVECDPGDVCQPQVGRCMSATGQCLDDQDCAPPITICDQRSCVGGCDVTGCGQGSICNPDTGRCVPFSLGTLTLGFECYDHVECLSNVCWPIQTSPTSVTTMCSETCVKHDDCPSGFLCYELGDGNLCMPRELISSSAPYNIAPGGTCGGSFVSETCMTGYCNTTRQKCMEMCGRDDDCYDVDASFQCIMRWPVGTDNNGDGDFDEAGELDTFTQLCHPPLFNGLPAGSTCSGGTGAANHDACASGYCVQTPDFYTRPSCASPCCTPTDCSPSAPVCKPIDAFDGLRDATTEPYGFQKVCLWREYQGAREVGEECASNADCKSELCAIGPSGSKRCTHTCCTNEDCAGYDWASACRPPFFDSNLSGDETMADDGFTQIIKAAGREYIAPGARDQAIGITPLCMPW